MNSNYLYSVQKYEIKLNVPINFIFLNTDAIYCPFDALLMIHLQRVNKRSFLFFLF